MTSYDDYCQQKAAPGGSISHYCYLFLPADRRRAITALHAYFREVDEAVNEPSDREVARTKLAWWRNETANLFAGSPQHPVTRALQPALAAFEIGEASLVDIMDGRERDLDEQRYADFASLEKYCQGVAGTMALLSARIFGYRDARTLEYAAKLGLASQLAHLLMTLVEDARKNRITLPMDELKRFDVPAADILNRRHSDNFRNLMSFQAERVERIFGDAMEMLPATDRRAQRPGLIRAAIERNLLDEIRREGFQVLTQRTVLTPLRMLWIAWKTSITA
jgi:phytoene synthase